MFIYIFFLLGVRGEQTFYNLRRNPNNLHLFNQHYTVHALSDMNCNAEDIFETLMLGRQILLSGRMLLQNHFFENEK